MSQAFDGRSPISHRVLTAIICGVWLWLFLWPMEQLNLLNDAQSFTLVFLALTIAQMTPWRILRFVVAVVVAELYVLNYYGVPGGFLHNVYTVTSTEWTQLVDVFRGQFLVDPLQTHAFLFAICGMYWLIVYASTRTRLWVFYNILGAIVLAIVDGNTPVHPGAELVAILVLFVVQLGFLQFRKLHLYAVWNWGPSPSVRYFTPLGILLGVSVVAALVLPKDGPVWADPTKTFAKWRGNGPGSVTQMIGYQEDNGHLGGSFVINHDPVISVVTKYPAYLRGQVYSFYTGKGWQVGGSSLQSVDVGQNFHPFGVNWKLVKGKPVTQQVTVLSDSVHAQVVLGAYAMQQIDGFALKNGESIQLVSAGNTVFAPIVHKDSQYTVTSYELEDPANMLKKLPPLPSAHQDGFSPDMYRQYIQLPDVPNRVRQLAEQVTAGKKTEYDIVSAVKDYLIATYPYETQGIPVPGEKDDYVDQFLFDSKKGYCNNFSSAMAVMLRAVGIPTRWVTGFAAGTADPNYTGDGSRYLYENADAHSWVEVFFPNIGWIPFDPTPTFSIPFVPTDATGGGNSAASPVDPVKPTQKHPGLKDDSGAGSAAPLNTFDWGAFFQTIIRIVGVVAVFGLIAAYIFRRKLREVRYRLVWKAPTPSGMSRALQYLIRVLRRFGDVPDRQVTLRDLRSAAKSYGIEDADYVHMVKTAESHWYGAQTVGDPDAQRVRKTWLTWMLGVLRRNR